jgi:hypothetical protein
MPDDVTDLGDLAPVTVDYFIGGKPFQLREATSDGAAKFRNAAAGTARITDGKVSGVGNVGDLEPLLVSLCLFDGDGKPVPLSVVRQWPGRVVRKLFDKAKTISGLDEDKPGAEDAGPKEPPSATATTST